MNSFIHRITARNHEPDCPWRTQLFDQRWQRIGSYSAFSHDRFHSLCITGVTNHPVATPQQSLCHVATHPSKSNHADLH
jgi:hypothetical protein